MSKEIQQSFKRIGGVALASVLLASCSQEWTSSDKFAFSDADNNPYAKGKKEMAVGRYGLAIESFRKALQSDPGSVKALNGLAAAYDLLGRFDLAERYYRLALNFDPSSIQSLNNLGYSYYLRGQYNKARGLFERAARVDAKNAIVAANMAALEKADMTRQVADARAKAGSKSARKATPTTWIERSDSQVQSLVTKPDAATLEAARVHEVEPRIVHTPRPLIEIATAKPVQVESIKPSKTPADAHLSVAEASTRHSVITVEGQAAEQAAPSAGAARKTAVALVATTQRPVKLEKVGPETQGIATGQASNSVNGATTTPKMDSYALIATSDTTPPAAPAVTMEGTAKLPKLNDNVARDVRSEQARTKTAALGDTPVVLPATAKSETPAPILTKAGKDAAAGSKPEAAVPANSEPVLPDAPGKVADTATPVLVETPSDKAAQQAGASLPAAEGHAASSTAKAKDSAPEPMRMAALGATKEPAQKATGQGKLAGEEASQELAALAKSVKIEISNGAGRSNMAHRMRQFLHGHGAAKMRLTNAISYTNKVSVLYFRPGHIANAKSLVKLLPVSPELRRDSKLITDLRLVLGGDMLEFDRGLIDQLK